MKLITESEPLSGETDKILYTDCGADIRKADGTWYYWAKTITPGSGEGQISDGTYSFTITAKDNCGNCNDTMRRSVRVDTVLPTAGIPVKDDGTAGG